MRIQALLRIAVLASTMVCVSSYANASLSTSLDEVYFAIGKGDAARATSLSVELLNTVPDTDRLREDVFEARIAVLYAVEQFAKPESTQALREAITRYTASHPHGNILLTRLYVTDGLAHGHARDAMDIIEKSKTTSEKSSEIDRAEMQVIETRVAALLDGRLDETRTASESALAFFLKSQSNHAVWHQLEMRHYLGNAFYYTGSKAKALEQFQTAFDVAVARFGAESDSRFRIVVDLSTTLADLGRNNEAIAVAESSYEAARRRYGDRHMKTVNAEAFLASKFQEIGDYPSSQTHFAHAEEMLATVADPPRREVGVIAVNYGNLLQEMGDVEAALKKYHEALDAWADEPSAQRSRAIVYANTGNTEFRMEHYAEFQRGLV